VSDTAASMRRRLHSATELRSVVRTMKSLAASSIGQYERAVQALGDYYRTVELGLGACLRAKEPDASMDRFEGRAKLAAPGAIVFGSDQGLVGQFNDVVVGEAAKTLGAIPGGARVWAVGERVRARLAEAGLTPTGVFEVPGSVAAIAPLVGKVLVETAVPDDRVEATELYLFYNRSAGAAAFAPVRERLLPLDDDWRRTRAAVSWPTRTTPEILGGDTATLRAMVREYLFVSLFRASAHSLASENASRLAAMDRAEKNIDDSLETLKARFQRLRQGSIDEELFDVVSGFEGLSEKRTASVRAAETAGERLEICSPTLPHGDVRANSRGTPCASTTRHDPPCGPSRLEQ
jgi:F-type H+-transporting ATPase subunit gamma